MGALDSNPRSIALILLAIGIFGIGAVLTFGFFSDGTLLGVGVTMIVIGAAGLLLGVIHMCAQDPHKRKKEEDCIAPPRIPKEVPHLRGEPEEDEDEELYYAPCSVSPPRGGRQQDGETALELDEFGNSPDREGGVVVPTLGSGGGHMDMLSPYDQRSFPVPALPRQQSGAVSPNTSRVVIESRALNHNQPHSDADVAQRLTGQLEAPHPAESRFRRQQSDTEDDGYGHGGANLDSSGFDHFRGVAPSAPPRVSFKPSPSVSFAHPQPRQESSYARHSSTGVGGIMKGGSAILGSAGPSGGLSQGSQPAMQPPQDFSLPPPPGNNGAALRPLPVRSGRTAQQGNPNTTSSGSAPSLSVGTLGRRFTDGTTPERMDLSTGAAGNQQGYYGNDDRL